MAGCVSGQTWALQSCSQGQGVEAGGFSLKHFHTHGAFCCCIYLFLFLWKEVVAPSVAKSGKKADEKLSGWWEHSLLPFALFRDPRHIRHHGPFCSSMEQL